METRFALALTIATLVSACRTEPAASPTAALVTAADRAPRATSEDTVPACVGQGGEPAKLGMRNVLGTALRACPSKTATGFYRDGFCTTGPDDAGVHVVCATVTDAFLQFSAAHGNDLITPRGAFPGLRDGDAWCLCAARFREALDAGVAPPVVVEATSDAALRTITASELSANSLELCREPR